MPLESPLARVRGSENLVTLHGRFGGETTFGGLGAGGEPTAVAVVSDLLAIARDGVPFGCAGTADRAEVSPEFTSAYYVRFTVADRPGIIAALASVFARHEINIDAILQEPGFPAGRRPFVVSLDPSPFRPLSGRLKDLAAFDFHGEAPVVLPVLSIVIHRSARVSYRAVFRCIAGCPGLYPLDTSSIAVRRAAACSRSPTISRPCAIAARQRGCGCSTSATSAPPGRTARAFGARRNGSCPEIEDDNVVSMDEGGTNLFLAERFGRGIGIEEVWVKLCGNSHTGSFKDLGMTVLVSMVRQMIARRAADPRRRLRVDRRYVRIARRVRGRRRHSGDRRTAARQSHRRATGAAARERRDRACARYRLRRLHGDHPEAGAGRGLYLANSMNSLRLEGQKTASIEIAQQFDWQVPDVVVVPGGNLGNIGAFAAGFEMMRDLGLVARVPRLIAAQAEAANPLYLASRNGWRFEPVVAKPTLASAIQIGNPVSIQQGDCGTATRAAAPSSRRASRNSLTPLPRADRTGMFACPHTGVALAALIKLAKRGEIKRDERVVVISTASGLKFTDFKADYHAGKLTGIAALRRIGPSSCRTTTTRFGGGLTWLFPREAAISGCPA